MTALEELKRIFSAEPSLTKAKALLDEAALKFLDDSISMNEMLSINTHVVTWARANKVDLH